MLEKTSHLIIFFKFIPNFLFFLKFIIYSIFLNCYYCIFFTNFLFKFVIFFRFNFKVKTTRSLHTKNYEIEIIYTIGNNEREYA